MRIATAALACLFLSVSPSGADEIRLEGGGTSINSVFLPIKKQFEKATKHKVRIVQSSAVKGLLALVRGDVDVATGAHPLEDLIAAAAREGHIIDSSNLVATEVEENQLAVIVHPHNRVTELTNAQLKDIFTGKITSWKELGGSDTPIKIIWGKETVGQNTQFVRLALDGQPVATQRHDVKTYRMIVETVAGAPGGIGVVPRDMSTAAVHRLQIPIIKSPIFAITKGAPSPAVKQLLEFYKKEVGFLKGQ